MRTEELAGEVKLQHSVCQLLIGPLISDYLTNLDIVAVLFNYTLSHLLCCCVYLSYILCLLIPAKEEENNQSNCRQ